MDVVQATIDGRVIRKAASIIVPMEDASNLMAMVRHARAVFAGQMESTSCNTLCGSVFTMKAVVDGAIEHINITPFAGMTAGARLLLVFREVAPPGQPDNPALTSGFVVITALRMGDAADVAGLYRSDEPIGPMTAMSAALYMPAR